MEQDPAGMQRWFIFSSNLDFQKTFDSLERCHIEGTISSLEVNKKGSMILHFVGWDPSRVMISPKGSITCYYYYSTIDPNEILPLLPEGHGYVNPEFSAVEAIGNELAKYLVPIDEEKLELRVAKSSLPREYFVKLRAERYGPITNVQFTNVRYVCSCGKQYKRKSWFTKHTDRCEIYDSKTSGIRTDEIVLAKPGERWFVGQSPFGFVRIQETVTWEMLKDACRHSPTIPIYLGHPRKSKW